MTTVLFAGVDVSLEMTSICVVDEDGRTIIEARAVRDHADIREVLAEADGRFERIGFEAAPVSQWLHSGLAPDRSPPAVAAGAEAL